MHFQSAVAISSQRNRAVVNFLNLKRLKVTNYANVSECYLLLHPANGEVALHDLMPENLDRPSEIGIFSPLFAASQNTPLSLFFFFRNFYAFG